MIREPPIQGVKGVNLMEGKIMLERKVMLREYDGHTAVVGDRVANSSGAEGEVVYVGKSQLIVEFEESLWIYAKSVRDKLWSRESYPIVNGFPVPAPAEEFTEGLVYIADPGHVEFHYSYRIGPTLHRETKLMFARGLAHRTEANAIAHAKAMLGIDPYARKSLDDAWDEQPAPPAGEGLPRAGGDAAPPTPPGASSP